MHWYRIVKALYGDNALPTTPEILFRTYVPGAALWDYLIAQITGLSAGRAMFAQQMLYSICAAPLLSLLPSKSGKKKQGMLLLLCVLCCPLLFEELYCVGVDALVALVPMAAALLLCTEEENERCRFWPVLMISAFTGLVKRSGLLFCALLAILYVLYCPGDHRLTLRRTRAQWGKALLLVVVPALLAISYRIRADVVYQGELGLQSGTAQYYLTHFSEKNAVGVAKMAWAYLKSLTDLRGYEIVRRYWAVAAALGLVVGLCPKENRPLYRLAPLAAVLLFFSYNIGLFATYLFSMDEIENTYLAAFTRYIMTPCVFTAGLTLCTAVQRLRVQQEPRRGLCAAAVLIAISLFFVNTSPLFGKQYDSEPGKTYRLAADSFQERFDYDGKRVLLVHMQNDDEFYLETFIMSYLRTENVKKVSIEEYREQPQKLAQTDADYVAFLGYAATFRSEISEILPLEQADTWGLYRINRTEENP